ncbi:leucine-rich repeat flightless-interacting protein 1 isoform X6 [Oncorhynchus keta]|uniref:leucine-rich repeat flightless-interacting protein 1 isoform X6 n=1 Tax=Oncorhynchus keta TaxID=8018 RepID=UPI00227AD074|nr:leucine-rich repeat flightless-interacting protein 1 isoform X6 [Oncorhynchus keta]
MGTQITGTGRKRIPNRERLTAEDDALNQIAREAEARLAAKRAARAEAREIRMKELERQQKEVTHTHLCTVISDDEERMSVGSRGSLRRNFSSDLYCSSNSLPSLRHQNSTQNGRPSMLFIDGPRTQSHRGSVCDEAVQSSTRRFSGSISRGPSDYSGFLGSNSRASSRASSARASPVVEERSDRDFLEKGSRTASTLSAATLASLGGPSSRRGSCDTSISVETEASIREIKDSLVESEEKYRKAMVSNAQLHNEKSNLMYQVDTLKDSLIELEEQLYESKREYNDKAKEFERERHAHSVLKRQFNEMRETLKQSEELLTEVGQLRLKQDSCVREISDLQETLGWKEKKIGALERQREFSDAGVRDERDKLRDQVVHLKDTLKKHGIVLSPEVTTNGDAGQMIDGPRSADSISRLAQESQPSHGGESMLGEAPEMQFDHGEVRTPGGGRLLHEADNYSHDQERALLEIESSDKLNQDKLNDSLQQQTDTEAEQSKYCDQETQVDVAVPEEAILVHFGDKETQIEYEVEKPQYCDTETLVEPAELEGAILVQKEYTDGGSDNGEELNQRGFEPESQEQAENEENSGESNREAVPVSGTTDGQCEENTNLEKGRENTELLTAVSTDSEEQDISGPTLCDETEATFSQIQSDQQGENTQEYDPGTKGQVIPENSRITESEMIKMILRISVCLGEAKTSPNQMSQGSLKNTDTIGMEMKNHPEHQAETGQVTSTGTCAISSTVSVELFISECPDEVGIGTDLLIINTLSEFEKDTQNSLELRQHQNDHFRTESSVEIVPKITDSDGQKLSERVEELESSSVESKPDQTWQESVCGMKEDEPNTKELQAKEPPSTISDKMVTPIITEEGKTRLDQQVIPDLPERLETSLENTLPGVQGDQKMDVAESREKQGCTCKCTCKQSESDHVLTENSLDVALTQRISDSSGEVISDRTEAVEPSPDRIQSESPSRVEREEWCIIEENIYEENLQQEAIQEEQQTEQGEASTSSPAGGDNELNHGASAGYIDSCEEAVLIVKEEETYLSVEEEHISSSPGPSALGQEIQPLPEAVEEGRERPPVEDAQKQESGVRKGQRGNRKGKGKVPCKVN